MRSFREPFSAGLPSRIVEAKRVVGKFKVSDRPIFIDQAADGDIDSVANV